MDELQRKHSGEASHCTNRRSKRRRCQPFPRPEIHGLSSLFPVLAVKCGTESMGFFSSGCFPRCTKIDAQDMRQTVQEAVNAICKRPDKEVPRAWKEKLLFFNTDTLRYSNLAKLKLDYWSRFSTLTGVFGAPNRVDKVAYAIAIHRWLRQVALHPGLIRFWEQAVRRAHETRGPHS